MFIKVKATFDDDVESVEMIINVREIERVETSEDGGALMNLRANATVLVVDTSFEEVERMIFSAIQFL